MTLMKNFKVLKKFCRETICMKGEMDGNSQIADGMMSCLLGYLEQIKRLINDGSKDKKERRWEREGVVCDLEEKEEEEKNMLGGEKERYLYKGEDVSRGINLYYVGCAFVAQKRNRKNNKYIYLFIVCVW